MSDTVVCGGDNVVAARSWRYQMATFIYEEGTHRQKDGGGAGGWADFGGAAFT